MKTNLILNVTLTAAIAGVLWLGAANTAQAHPDYGCKSCHVPHNAHTDKSVPLWNPEHTTTTLTEMYASDTMDATATEVNGASKLCMSCHDGVGYTFRATSQHKIIGTLTTSHPISFVYDSALAALDGELVDPAGFAADPSMKDVLDASSRMQCTSCHDVHGTSVANPTNADGTPMTDSSGNTITEPNLRWPYNTPGYGVTATFCRNCHLK